MVCGKAFPIHPETNDACNYIVIKSEEWEI